MTTATPFRRCSRLATAVICAMVRPGWSSRTSGASESSVEAARDAVKKNNLTWKNFYDGGTSGAISTRWNVSGWPTTYVIDSSGVIRYKDVRGDDLDEAIEALLAEMNAREDEAGTR